MALDSGRLPFNNPEMNQIKEHLLSRSTPWYYNNTPKWHMQCLLFESNEAIEGFDIDTSNMIKEIFYNYIKVQILNGSLRKFFINNSKMKGDKSKIFDHYSEEILYPSIMRMSKKNKVNQNYERTSNNVTKKSRKKKYESKTTGCFVKRSLISYQNLFSGEFRYY